MRIAVSMRNHLLENLEFGNSKPLMTNTDTARHEIAAQHLRVVSLCTRQSRSRALSKHGARPRVPMETSPVAYGGGQGGHGPS